MLYFIFDFEYVRMSYHYALCIMHYAHISIMHITIYQLHIMHIIHNTIYTDMQHIKQPINRYMIYKQIGKAKGNNKIIFSYYNLE